MTYLYAIAAVMLAYLLGSLSFAVIVSQCMGLKDPRSYGSNNPGATNVLRSGNKLAAVATLLLDGLKGWLPVVLVKWFGHDYGLDEGTVAAVGLAAFIGHLYPVFFQFKGGKGVATAAGVLLGVDGLLGLATLATWIIIAFFSRYSSLAALAAAVFAPLYYLLGDRAAWYVDKSILLAIFVISAMLVYRHRDNITKLLKGTESRLGSSKKAVK
ncbi:MAG: glycerol-3-phosphate 1-O-acyltransferase PlsY [Polaromonas sp.]|nr:MAG: glycerol-3-phosphate 1-O-acyltransferase PlsY [Polaromonas sp.]